MCHPTAFLCTEISGKHGSVCPSLHPSPKPLHAQTLNCAEAETRCRPSLQTLSLLGWCESKLIQVNGLHVTDANFFVWHSNWFRMSWGGGEEVGVSLASVTDSSFLPLEICAVAAVPVLPGGSRGQNHSIPAAHALPWSGLVWSGEDDAEGRDVQPRSV